MDEQWKQIEASFTALFERQWYTNQGPLTRELEDQIQAFFSVRNAVCVVNPAIGLAMALEMVSADDARVVFNTASHVENMPGAAKALQEACEPGVTLVIDCTGLNEHELYQWMKALPRRAEQGRWIALLPMDRKSCMNAQGGACLVTEDDELAEVLRNIRSSYGVRRAVPVMKTANGRMSEAQAAFGLIALNALKASKAQGKQQP